MKTRFTEFSDSQWQVTAKFKLFLYHSLSIGYNAKTCSWINGHIISISGGSARQASPNFFMCRNNIGGSSGRTSPIPGLQQYLILAVSPKRHPKIENSVRQSTSFAGK
jgi:hypothetical protein